MDGRVIPFLALTAEDEHAWKSLASRAVEPNPLFEASCLIPAAEHLSNGPGMSLVVAEEKGRIYGCIPIQQVDRFRALHRPVLTTQVRRMFYDGTPLLDSVRSVDAMAAIFTVLAERSRGGEPGLLALDWLHADMDGQVAAAVHAAAKRSKMQANVYNSWDRPIVRRRVEATYRSIHGGKFLRNLGRLRRNMSVEFGSEVRFVDRSADETAIEEVIRLEAATPYKLERGVAMTRHPGEPEWFRSMCERFQAEGRLRVFTLEVDAGVCALQLFLESDGGWFLLKLAYDGTYSHFRPGMQLHLDVIDHFHSDATANWIDSCTYEGNETLLRMYPDRRKVSTVVVGLGGLLDRSYLRALSTARGVVMPGSAARSRHESLDKLLNRVEPTARRLIGRPAVVDDGEG